MAFLSIGAYTGQTKRPSPPIDKFVANTGATDNIGSTRVFRRYVIAHKPSTRDFGQAHGDAPAVQTEMECIVALLVTLLEEEPDNWQQYTDEPLVIRMWLSEDKSVHSLLSPEVMNNDKANAVNSHCVFGDIWGRRKKVKIDYGVTPGGMTDSLFLWCGCTPNDFSIWSWEGRMDWQQPCPQADTASD
uniref:Uncharacterized protein n=1 Tax=Chromera velia CCMP2878 TaxID=1169474 RepID=A0A0G4HF48_9ALVE|eukprot:Cvel_26938.t1-p1 / transcript=Cvel_26938.t1 / gene=Cvel_26938 / organism=Chromera_velia_CCMP2878 / gene_product=hypothetical protein / transcript_product=hypothetical protein / location=Cvel_scaffold3280:5224-5784(-) / protein_length=187 / sequence_SO=supercontig / SO=protein_coding / is_pseudo=false